MPTLIADRPPRPRAPQLFGQVRARLAISFALALCILTSAVALPPHSASAATPSARPASDFTLTAQQVTIDGLRINGVGPAPGDRASRPTLRLSIIQALAQQLLLQAPSPGSRLTVGCPTNCVLAGRPAQLYVLELTATPVVAGIPTVPITLTPTSPLPPPEALGLLQLPRLTFRDFRARLTLLTGDVLQTPATRIVVAP